MNDGDWTALKNFGGFCPSGGVAGGLVFENEDDSIFLRLFGSLPQFVIDGRAIRSLILQPPEIEATNAVCLKCFGHRDGTIQDFILLLKVKFAPKALASLNFDFGAPGQSILNSGLAISVTLS